MSTLRPSPEHQREIEARLRGQKIQQGPGVVARRLDVANAGFKAMTNYLENRERQRRAEGAPERLTQAREAIGGARTQRELDQAFSNARRTLRR